MGQRIIISESEKNHIKNLYEAETAPPPDESVLVAKKNPFKYPEYESARRIYSSDLEDGDMFYEMDTKYYSDKREEIEKIKNLFLPSLNNKTARFNDDIYTFLTTPINEFGGGGTMDIGEINIKKNDESYTRMYNVFYLPRDKTIRFYYPGIKTYSVEKFGEHALTFPKISELFSKQHDEINEKYKNITTLPDEYFEIRKIQRKQTDF